MNINDAKFLICDDSILARKQLKDVISGMGNPVIIQAANGEEAINAYKKHHPDITFLDIVMPVKDGNVAIQEIMEYDSNAKIIVVSSVGTQSQLKCAIESGATDFIQKPVDEHQVKETVKKYLED